MYVQIVLFSSQWGKLLLKGRFVLREAICHVKEVNGERLRFAKCCNETNHKRGVLYSTLVFCNSHSTDPCHNPGLFYQRKTQKSLPASLFDSRNIFLRARQGYVVSRSISRRTAISTSGAVLKPSVKWQWEGFDRLKKKNTNQSSLKDKSITTIFISFLGLTSFFIL